MPQLEGPTTKIYNYVLGGFGEKKKKKKRRLATDVSSGANLKKLVISEKKKRLNISSSLTFSLGQRYLLKKSMN